MTSPGDRHGYDIGDSQAAQTNFLAVASHLETIIAERDQQVKAAMADARVDGADATYLAKEAQWNTLSTNTKSIVQALKQAMTENDGTAQTALAKAKAAVDAIA